MRYESELQHRLEGLAPEPGRRLDMEGLVRRGRALRRQRTLLVMFVGLVSAVVVASSALILSNRDDLNRIQPAPAPSVTGPDGHAPTKARVECIETGARVLTPKVAPRRDGIHIEITNSTGAEEFYIRRLDNAGANHGGTLKKEGTTSVRSSLGPGELLIGCVIEGEDSFPYYDAGAAQYDSIEVVDPLGLWVDVEPSCPSPVDRGRFRADRDIGTRDPKKIARLIVPGIRKTDELRFAGYRMTEWHGAEILMVVRGQERVARLSIGLGRPQDAFGNGRRPVVQVDACPDSGIGDG